MKYVEETGEFKIYKNDIKEVWVLKIGDEIVEIRCYTKGVEAYRYDIYLTDDFVKEVVEDFLDNNDDIFYDYGLVNGRVISFSKSLYRELNKENLIIFNAVVTDKKGKILWNGDLDINKDKHKLFNISEELGTDLYVFYESAKWGEINIKDATWTTKDYGVIFSFKEKQNE